MKDAAIKYAEESVEHAHNTVPVQVWIDIDEGIAPLIVAFNEMRGIRTFASCQGHLLSKVESRADIMFCRDESGPTYEQLANLLEERAGSNGWELQVWEGDSIAMLYVEQDRIVALANALCNAFPRLLARYPAPPPTAQEGREGL